MNHGWEKKKLGDVCTKSSSNIQQGKLSLVDDGYEIFGASGLIGKVDFFQQPSEYIGIVKDGSGVGKTNVYPPKTSVIGTMQYILPNPGVSTKYLCYAIKSLNLSKYVNGAAIPHIYFRDYQKEQIPIPSIEQQQAIVAELDALNEAIEMKRKQLKALDALAQALFYDTFGDPVENPKGWEIKTLSGIATIQTGATPSRKKQNNFAGSIPWVKTTEVHNCDIFSTEEHISETALNESNCKIFPIDTILIAMYGQGKTRGQVARLKIAASTNQACAAILPNSDLNQTFLFRLLRCSYEDLRGKAIGGNQKNLNLLLIKKYPVILPPLPLQQHFAAQVEEIERGKENVEATIARLQTLLDSRMDYWFND